MIASPARRMPTSAASMPSSDVPLIKPTANIRTPRPRPSLRRNAAAVPRDGSLRPK